MSSSSPSLRERLNRFKNNAGPAGVAVFVILAVLFLASLIYLIKSGGPWERSLQKKLATGKELSWEQYRQLGVGWGILGLSGLLAFALGTVKWWIIPSHAPLGDKPRFQFSKTSRWLYFAGLVLAMGMALFSRVPRLDQSFWNDEERAFRKFVYGEIVVDADGKLQHKPVSWGKAMFDNESANNHWWSTVESRLGMAIANNPNAGSPEGIPAFQERAARIFPLISSALSILAIGWLGWLLGYPRAGIIAAILMALSPWHVRYSVEIRGYSTMLLGLTLGLGCLIRALESSKWRWWIAYGACQAVYLLCFTGAIYLALAINVVALFGIWQMRRAPLANGLRLVVANVFSAVPLAIFMAPAVLQLSQYVKDNKDKFPTLYPKVNMEWMWDMWSHVVIGGPPTSVNTAGSNGLSLADLSARTPWVGPVAMIVIPILALVGIGAMLQHGWRSRLIACGILLGAVLATVAAMITKTPFVSWYLIYILPLFCLALPWVACWAPKRLAIVPFVIAGVYFIMTQAPRDRMTQATRQPLREVAQYARAEKLVPTGTDAKTVTATFGTSDLQIKSYDPRSIELDDKDAPSLQSLMDAARANGTPLVVYFCDRAKAENNPKLAALLGQLDDPANWRREARLPGMETKYSYEVFLFANLRQEGQPLKK